MKKIYILAGPTGVGKTQLSLDLAKRINAEIISADSMQIYRGMDIGTAKILPSEMQGVVHHMIDVVSPFEPFSVHDFMIQSQQLVEDIHAKGKMPLFVGGTGLYINTLLYEMDFNKASIDTRYREELWDYHRTFGTDALYQKLTDVDPQTKIEKENIKRVIRALEIYKEKGHISQFDQMTPRKEFDAKLFILNRPREELYENINRRVDDMLEKGLIQEVKELHAMGLTKEHQSMKAIGYLQVLKYFSGEYTLEEMIEKIKQESRRYAKRQITWFKRYHQAKWFDLSEMSKEDIVSAISQEE